MKLILTSDVEGLGHKGDVVQVADGYARNYLVPRSLAVKATRGALAGAERIREIRQEALRKEREAAEYQRQMLPPPRKSAPEKKQQEGQGRHAQGAEAFKTHAAV